MYYLETLIDPVNMEEKQGNKANLCQNDENGQVRNYSSSSQLHDVLAGLQSWCAGRPHLMFEEAWSENDLSPTCTPILTEIDQITIYPIIAIPIQARLQQEIDDCLVNFAN